MLAINSNIGSLYAQRQLNRSQSGLERSLQRLSSGRRINGARDDAAGLAISERMSSQARGLNQAVRNASDGISLARTVEGSLGEYVDNLQRIRELAVQAANATNSASDRAALNTEVGQRLAELERLAQQTKFNGTSVLDGSAGSMGFQIGANVGERIDIDLGTSMRTVDIGNVQTSIGASSTGNDLTADGTAFGVSRLATSANKSTAGANSYGASVSGAYQGVSATAFDGANLAINGQDIAASSGYTGGTAYHDASSAFAKAAAIAAADIDGLQVSAETSLSFGTTGGTGGSTDFLAMWSQGSGLNPGLLDYTLTINGVDVLEFNRNFGNSGNVSNSLASTTLGISMSTAVDAINDASGSTGVSASIDDNGNLNLVAADGRNIEIQEYVRADIQNPHPESAIVRTAFSEVEQNGFEVSTTQNHTYRGQLKLDSTGDVELTGTTAAAGFAGTLSVAGDNLGKVSVGDVASANAAITMVDQALAQATSLRSRFGAVQNRMDSVIANLGQSVETLYQSRSRITDTDFAEETAALTRAQILQQAGVAMLSQANSLPQNVLSLLQ